MVNKTVIGKRVTNHKTVGKSSISFVEKIFHSHTTNNSSESSSEVSLQNDASEKHIETVENLLEKYHLIICNSHELIAFTTFDINPIFTFVNPSYKKILGYDEEDLVGKSSLDFIHQDDKQRLMRFLFTYVDAKINGFLTPDMVNNTPELEFCIRDKSGYWHKLHSTVDIVNEELLFISKEVSGPDTSQNVVISSDRQYLNLYNRLRDGSAAVDLQGKIIECNQSFTDMIGYSIDELRTKTFEEITPVKWHSFEREILEQEVMKRGYSKLYEKEYIRKDGTIFPVELQTYAIRNCQDQVCGFWAFVRDITNRKQIEKALQETEKRFRLAIQSITDILYEWNVNTGLIEWFGDIDSLMGYGPGLFPRSLKGFLNHVHPDDVNHVRAIADAGLQQHQKWEGEYRVIMKNGSQKYWYGTGIAVNDEDGTPVKVIGSVKDITQQKIMEESLRENEEKYRKIVENTQDLIMLTRPDGVVEYLSPACVNVIGYNPEDIIGKIPEIFYSDDVDKVHSALSKALQGVPGVNLEYRVLTKTGGTRWVSHSWTPIFTNDEKIRYIVSVVRNITDSKFSEGSLKMKVDELERYKNITVNREIKMIELKKENKALKDMIKDFEKRSEKR